MTKAYAAAKAGDQLIEFEFDLGPLGDQQVDIKVEYCGICHSDLSMLDNEWGMTKYPLVPGHEVIGIIESIGAHVNHLRVGQRVGLGWCSSSCGVCEWCLTGNHNLCSSALPTVLGPYGGFADKVRAQATWVLPLPEILNPEAAGPLFCGGITVFNPLVQFNVKPTDRVGVIGIGGLGHMAIKFLHAWGCEVTAFSHSGDKELEAKQLGADHFVDSTDSEGITKLAGSFDFILSTVNVALEWNIYINALRPKGRLHFVGAVLQPITVSAFDLFYQKSLSASPIGGPQTMATMLDFAARHGILPQIETFPFSRVNEALERLRHGNPRYRIVLKH